MKNVLLSEVNVYIYVGKFIYIGMRLGVRMCVKGELVLEVSTSELVYKAMIPSSQ